jgi:hypothetical protein
MASGKLLPPSLEGTIPETRQKEVRDVAESNNGIVNIASRSWLTSGSPV